MARKRTVSHFFFEKKCVLVPKSLIWLHNFNPDKVFVTPRKVFFQPFLLFLQAEMRNFSIL